MEIQASRAAARIGPSEADPASRSGPLALDHLLVRRGLAALERTEQLGGRLGPYALQAAIAACHARARTAQETDWTRIAALYDALGPDRAVARRGAESRGRGRHGVRRGRGLALVDGLASEPALKYYHLLPSVRGDLLVKLGRLDEARGGIRARGLAHPQRARRKPSSIARRVA